MDKDKAFKIGLPKWPQCVINGDKITREQALEIIRRTDRFFFGCASVNNKQFNKEAESICKMPKFEDYYNDESLKDSIDEFHTAEEEFRKKWDLVETEYIHNSWISCGWIGGSHGWCHPDGTIAFCNNIGKWPNVEDVYNDLCIIGKHFPFINLTCTLMDGEECETYTSLVSMKLENGEVSFIDTIPFKELQFNGVKPIFNYNRRENYFGLNQIQKWANQVYNSTANEI